MQHGHVIVIGSPWIMRQGVRKMLRRIGLAIVAEGNDCDEACRKLGELVELALVLVIVSQAEHIAAGLNSIRVAAARFPEAKLILIADGIDDARVREAASIGANAVLSPNLSSDMLGSSVQLVLVNQNLFPDPSPMLDGIAEIVAENAPKLVETPAAVERPVEPALESKRRESRILLREWPDEPPPRQPSALLNLVWNNSDPTVANALRPLTPSDREWEILQCLSNGDSNKNIARQLGIAETTVKVHVKSLLRKLGVTNRTQAAIWALNHSQSPIDPAMANALHVARGE